MIYGRLIDFAAFNPWIDECPQADFREISWPAGGDGAIERGQLALRQAHGFGQPRTKKRGHARHQSPMRPDNALDEAFDGEMLEADLSI